MRMKLFNFYQNNKVHLGTILNGLVIDITATVMSLNEPAWVSKSMGDVLKKGKKGIIELESWIKALEPSKWITLHSIDSVLFAPLVMHPEKILCVGLNYKSHSEECQMTIPENPVIFSKFNNALAGHKEFVKIPDQASEIDYEAELVIVMGETAYQVDREEALDYVLGYTIGNDLSARDFQFKTPQWLLGKTCDGFAPIGPYLTPSEMVDVNHLDIKCTVNGVVKQHANTSDMIFDCATIVSYLSHHMTLKAGDVIFTGTPSGVILGNPESERVWLKEGDCIKIEIEGLGELENTLKV